MVLVLWWWFNPWLEMTTISISLCKIMQWSWLYLHKRRWWANTFVEIWPWWFYLDKWTAWRNPVLLMMNLKMIRKLLSNKENLKMIRVTCNWDRISQKRQTSSIWCVTLPQRTILTVGVLNLWLSFGRHCMSIPKGMHDPPMRVTIQFDGRAGILWWKAICPFGV